MKLPRWIRITLWVSIILLAALGVPLAGALPINFKKDNESLITTEQVEERNEDDEQECLF